MKPYLMVRRKVISSGGNQNQKRADPMYTFQSFITLPLAQERKQLTYLFPKERARTTLEDNCSAQQKK